MSADRPPEVPASLAPDSDAVPGNRLGSSTSPYLRQHAHNPVHWREWSSEALSEAADRDVPVLLSVGYAACHWCHVMAHESFEDPATAALMNEGFVCVKVDREERPDIDAIYMNATVAMTGQGGWPMTCFLTPDGEPFYCGTYYPPSPRGGMPSFQQLLHAIGEAWRNRRSEILAMGAQVAQSLEANAAALPAGGVTIDPALLDEAVRTILADEDTVAGGFGGAPKFPPSALAEGLLRHHERTGSPESLSAVRRVCTAMARGGINDQLAGGFARYAVDNDWVIPHFEKMLYDNAQLLRVYAHLARITDDPLARRTTEEIVGFLERDLRVRGGYASSLDADAAGVEGSTYVWTPEQLYEALGDDEGHWAAALFEVTEAGTFEHGTSTLQLLADPADAARFDRVRERLLEARGRRVQPDRDDKVVTGWNAMAATALAEAGAGLGRQDWVDLALGVVEEVLRLHVVDGVLRRSSLDGRVGEPVGALDDHAALCVALFTLHQVTGRRALRDAGLELLDTTLEMFADPAEPGSWFDAVGTGLIVRPRDPVDGATPAGASLLAEALLLASTLADAQACTRYAELADATLGRAGLLLARAARSAGHWVAVAQARMRGPLQIAVSEAADSTGELAARAWRVAPGGTVIVAGAADSLPLLEGRGPVNGRDAAYICRGSVCGLPVTEPEELAQNLG